ncbi:MAG: fibronectin type III domain-containing protein, partial [Nanoarchaeota archaeon]
MKRNTRMNIGAFMIVLMLSLPFATAESLKITDIQVKEVSDRYAIINWVTDQFSSSQVKFGENSTELDNTKSNSRQVLNHTLLLKGLKSDTKYFFNVSSQNSNGTSAMEGLDFTTALIDTIPPFINVEIPDSINKNTLNIVGTTEPNAEIYIYI